jgi:hypothetical protein
MQAQEQRQRETADQDRGSHQLPLTGIYNINDYQGQSAHLARPVISGTRWHEGAAPPIHAALAATQPHTDLLPSQRRSS